MPKILFENSSGKNEKKKILVIAPHPDDETLACSTAIDYAVKNNVPFKIVIMTNGDLFLPGKRAVIKDRDGDGKISFTDYGYTRQEEVANALSSFGVNKQNIVFLGYPDAFLWDIYNEEFNDFYINFEDEITFEKVLRINGMKFSPYNNTYHQEKFPSEKALYCAEYITRDLRSIIEDFAPTDIFVSHELDTHFDHRATPLFLRRAVKESIESGNTSAGNISIHRYLVHFNYDDSIGDMTEYPDPASAELYTRDILNGCSPVAWDKTAMGSPPDSKIPLNKELTELKRKAVDAFSSQLINISLQTECDSEKYLWLYQFVKESEEWWDWPADYPLPFKTYDSFNLAEKCRLYLKGVNNFLKDNFFERFKITQ